ncbi:RHS repeat-associated core domain-containing protein [Chryseobacterium sp. RG1]|uniref:RHS repeat-associated core domain-containing protein n=1 Tax=Chryseobacterium tagetis TaxID=2801334 RepID=A0ABS8A4F5_9FLAO|nr:DUF6443 domain-containing protein [Chryseobacterium tagetis]MCA6068833.1 RHS repeat-associated core domain-containing protein [Chryseobacterium tagetis]
MKKLILFLLLFVAQSIWAQIPTASENYVSTKVYLSADGSKKTETVQYFDGLGRAKEVIQVKATPLGKDLVVPVVYDQQGRATKTLLPVPVATANSGIHGTDENTVNSYYGGANAFSDQKLESSPLARVLEVAGPGTEWAMATGHTTKMQYLTNTTGDQVKKYNTSVSWSNATLTTNISNVSYYNANQLSKNRVTDENGNITTDFKNSEGKTILLRKGEGADKLDTYYIYNNYGQLAFVISPKADQQITINSNTITGQILDDLCYRYVYDNKFRLVEKKLPGKGWEYMVYDRQNRLVASQDTNMRNNPAHPNTWLFTRYDKYGRVVYTGQFTGSTRLQEQSNANAKELNNESRSTTAFTLNGQEIFYTNTAYPSAVFTPYSVNYYDTYPFSGLGGGNYPLLTEVLSFYMTNTTQSFSSNGVNSMRNLKLMPTSSYVKNLDDDSWSASHIWYDALLRPIGSKNINYLGGYTNTEKELDFSGAVLRANTFHKKTNASNETVIKERFTYDDQYRVRQHYHQVNGNNEELLAEYTYNELGQVSKKSVGNGIQDVEYTYNIRGTVTKVNDPSNLNGKLFGYELKFASTSDASVAPANYNGNITEMIWKSTNDNLLKKYSYRYDQYNRLLAGLYQEPETTIPQNGFYNETMSYDANGNIAGLQRNQKNSGGFAQQIDNLTYAYAGNRLLTVTDSSKNYAGYPDVSGNTIAYDDNGNMKDHIDKGILQIDYNLLNLPKYVKFNQAVASRGGALYVNSTFLYRADGVKLKKLHQYKDGTNEYLATKTTDYLDGFQYEGDATLANPMAVASLKFVPTSEGYYNFENNKYIYSYTDHLGNVRVSYTRNTTSGSAEALEENNYYPFGLRQTPAIGVGNPAYKYQYNGKELQGETGWSDYGARMYMSDIGRWGGIDPLAEKARRFTPYHYGNNNPIRFTDPDGMQSWDNLSTYNAGSSVASFLQRSGVDEEYMPKLYADSSGMMIVNTGLGNDGEGGGGGATIGELMDNLGITAGSIESYMQAGFVLSLKQQLIDAGWDDPAHTKAKFDDIYELVKKVPELKRLFEKFTTERSIKFQNGGTQFPGEYLQGTNIVAFDMKQISNILQLAFTGGHEMLHLHDAYYINRSLRDVFGITTVGTAAISLYGEYRSYTWMNNVGYQDAKGNSVNVLGVVKYYSERLNVETKSNIGTRAYEMLLKNLNMLNNKYKIP